MSSKFLDWVDSSHLDNVLDYNAFSTSTDRNLGFRAGTRASAITVNTALRQANIVACALMNIVDPTGTVDFRNSVSAIETILQTYLTETLSTSNAANVTTSINNKALNQIFEANGTTVKNATNAVNATNSDKATKIVYTTTAPTASPETGTLIIYVGSTLPETTYDRVIYMITY